MPIARRIETTAAALAVLLLLMLAVPAGSRAESAGRAYTRDLDEIELQLRFGIELGPAELEQDVAFTERLCLTAQAAEAAAETPAARIDWQGLKRVVLHNDLGLTKEIAGTLHGVDRRLERLGKHFAVAWHRSPAKLPVLHHGVGQVRGGILHLEAALSTYRHGFARFLRHDCAGGEAAVESGRGPIRRGLVRVEAGMGLLWLLAEPGA
jgi:hypothetical protein